MITIEHEIDLTTIGKTPRKFIEVSGSDLCSIHATMLTGGASFNSGVITVSKANSFESIIAFGTPVTISAPGLTELTSSDWVQARYLVFACTTAAAAANRVLLTIHLNKIGFKL